MALASRRDVQALYQFADQYGVPRRIALALVRQESGGNPRAISPAGAIGYTQLMPGTARGLGVNPRDPIDNLRGGMKYLGHLISSFGGNIRNALAAYNAGPGAVTRYGGIPPYKETRNYVRSIMGMAGPGQQGPVSVNRLAAANLMNSSTPIGAVNPRLQAALDLSAPSADTESILGRLGGIAGRAAEAASAPIPLPLTPSPGGGGQGPFRLPGMPPIQAVGQGGRLGRVSVAAGANRAGVGLAPDIVQFARSVAGTFGRPLKITTGTNHNQYVLGTRRQSAHWTGEAADIAASGARLTRMGQAALIAAGMPRAQALKQTGGLFNVGGYQVIFNSNEGGNHYNHLHIGIRGRG